MRDDQRRAAPLAQVAFQPFHRLDIQVVGRLVQDQQVGVGEQQARQHRPRALPAGKLRDGAVVIVGVEAQPAQRLADARLVGVAAAALELVLQRPVALQGGLRLFGVAHRCFQARQLRLQLPQARQRLQAFLPQAYACRSAWLPAAGSPLAGRGRAAACPCSAPPVPSRMRSKVVFPIPLGPTMAMRPPGGMLSVTPEKISVGTVGFAQVVGGDQRHGL